MEEEITALLEQRATLEAALSEVIQFEEALSNISTPWPLDATPLQSVKVATLASQFPFFDWKAFLKNAFAKIVHNDSLINDDTEVLIQV